MITNIEINGFKSFHKFEMEFTPFTVIAGANASGKSNLFDALKLLGRLVETDNLKKAFEGQRGEFSELFTQYSENDCANEMEFAVEMLVDKTVKDAWGNEKTLKYTRLRYELKIKKQKNNLGIENVEVIYEHLDNIKQHNDNWIKIIPKEKITNWRPTFDKKVGKQIKPYLQTIIESNIPTVYVNKDETGGERRILLTNATRTVLSSFDTVDFPHVLAAKQEMINWKFLQLNPDDLRKPTSKNRGTDTITESGENLAAALYRIKQDNENNLNIIANKLQSFIPNFIGVDVVNDTENKQFIIKLKDKDKKIYTSNVLSEGTLRILAMCILNFQYTGLLCFEEPENGIYPIRISAMANLLYNLSIDFKDIEMPLRQVIVNTHSTVLVSLINKWEYKPNVSICFLQIRSNIAEINSKRLLINATTILKVHKENEIQLNLSFTESEKKLTLSVLKQYLETANIETL